MRSGRFLRLPVSKQPSTGLDRHASPSKEAVPTVVLFSRCGDCWRLEHHHDTIAGAMIWVSGQF